LFSHVMLSLSGHSWSSSFLRLGGWRPVFRPLHHSGSLMSIGGGGELIVLLILRAFRFGTGRWGRLRLRLLWRDMSKRCSSSLFLLRLSTGIFDIPNEVLCFQESDVPLGGLLQDKIADLGDEGIERVGLAGDG
jgi:hypothetical protein